MVRKPSTISLTQMPLPPGLTEISAYWAMKLPFIGSDIWHLSFLFEIDTVKWVDPFCVGYHHGICLLLVGLGFSDLPGACRCPSEGCLGVVKAPGAPPDPLKKGQVLVGSWFFLIFFLRIYFSVHCKRRGLSLCIGDALDFMLWKARGKLPRDKGKVCSEGSQPSTSAAVELMLLLQYTSCLNKELHNSSIHF